jgi:hypothetical protein
MATHDPITPHNYSIHVEGPEGALVRVRVRVEETVPAGGIDLDVLWDPQAGKPVSVTPWRNLGRFISEAIAHEAGGSVGH